MGIFIKFECDNCGEYECNCSYEERMGYIREPIDYSVHKDGWRKEFKYGSHTYGTGDILVDVTGKQFFIEDVNNEKEMYKVRLLSDRADYVAWRAFSTASLHNKLESVRGN
jgi:hypothetical protein